MKNTEIIRNIIEEIILHDDFFEELRWLFKEYDTAALLEKSAARKEDEDNGKPHS